MSIWDIVTVLVSSFGLAWLMADIIFKDHDDDLL